MGENRKSAPGLCNQWALPVVVSILAVALSIPAPAGAEFSPDFSVSLRHSWSGPSWFKPVRADEVPDLTVAIRQGPQDDCDDLGQLDDAGRMRCFMMLRKIKVAFPHGWKVNNMSPLTPGPGLGDMNSIGQCRSSGEPNNPNNLMDFETPVIDENGIAIGNECAENTVIGRVYVSMVSPVNANRKIDIVGNVHLLSSNENDDPVRLGIYLLVPTNDVGDAVVAIGIYGNITLEGELGEEQIVAVFDGIPEEYFIESFTFRLTNSNQRGLIRTPVTCDRPGERRFDAVFWDAMNVQVEGSSNPVVSNDCILDRPQSRRTFEPTMRVMLDRTRAAGGHPDLRVLIGGDMNDGAAGKESLKGLRLLLPQGMVGSLFPFAFARGARCGAGVQADAWRGDVDPCEQFKVGAILAAVNAAQQRHIVRGSVYLSDPMEDGDLAALRFVFPSPPKRLDVDGIFDKRDPLVLTAGVRLNPGTNRVEAIMRDLPTTFEIKYVKFIVRGEPAGAVRPFLTNPTSCSMRGFDATLTSDRKTEHKVKSDFQATDCNLLAFSPEFTLDLLNSAPNRATEAEITVRQPEGQAHTRAARMFFAQGLRTNSELDGVTPCRAADVSECGADSKIGTATANSPALEGAPFNSELQGDLHLMHTESGRPMEIATALTNDQLPGLVIKQQGVIKMVRDGSEKFQIVSDLDLPELPISDFRVRLEKKLLRSPWRCGRASLDSKADFTSYSGLSHTSSSSERLDGCGAALPYNPGLEFSPQTNTAGTPTDLTVGFTRAAGDQTTRDVELKLPNGWSADVLTKPICSNADAGRSACPGNSRIGSVTASARIFKFLPRLNVNGDIYRCAPEGNDAAAACIDLILPEIAGEGHLRLKGRILVRNNAEQISVVVKDIPTEFDVELKMQIEGSTTPSFCSPNPASAGFTGEADTTASSEAGYSSAACENLKYRPQLDFAFSTTKPNAEPAITTRISQSAGDATTSKMNVTLPKGLRPNLVSFAKGCSDAQWSARSCPTETKLGDMEVATPLLNDPLKGPVYFGEGAKIYMQLDGLVPLNIEGRVTLSGRLGFEVSGLPPQPLRTATVHLKQGLFKNPSECETGSYNGEFTSHAGHTATSAGSVGLCSGGKKNGLKLSAKLKPNTAKAYPKALFKITQERSKEKSIRSFKIKLGKGAKARQLRFSTSRLARKGKARRKGSLIGTISISPAKRGPSISGIVYGQNRRVKVKSDRRQLRRLSKKSKKAKTKKVKSQAKRDLAAVRKLQKTLQKKARIKLKGNALMVSGLPNVKSKRISLRLNGKRYRLLRNPRKAGKMKLAGTFKLSGNTTARAEAKVKIRKGKKRSRARAKK